MNIEFAINTLDVGPNCAGSNDHLFSDFRDRQVAGQIAQRSQFTVGQGIEEEGCGVRCGFNWGVLDC